MTPPLRQRSRAPRPRCERCRCWLTRIGADEWTCSNESCGLSWQAAKRNFESSMLGAAIRQVIGDRNA